jgi:pyruvate/2-oxoglutarate dehydrogenase complex dihydrolipoamide acyltransferase (E2) component
MTLAEKIGEPFNAGDVLLEIETDKAQMDVEAQDNGILAKILVPDGAQKVNVGKVIAVLAEEGDDISSVEMPAETQETSTQPTGKVEESSRDAAETGHDGHKNHLKFKETYLPAVLRLLQQYGIEDPKTILGTGPHGRLLKGDVLAHVGTIKSDVPKSLQRILEGKQRLDLTNVVIQRPQDAPQPNAMHPPETSTKPPPFACVKQTVAFSEVLRVQKKISGQFRI